MRSVVSNWVILATAAMFGIATPAEAARIYEISYQSITSHAFDNFVHLRNTGIPILPGEQIDLVGWGLISFGGGNYRATNFAMGIISSSQDADLKRTYSTPPGSFGGTPVPLPGEELLFGQEMTSFVDQHDVSYQLTAASAGTLYIGLYDINFADNIGTHYYRVTITPEPTAVCIPLLGTCLLRGRRRAHRS